MGPASPKTTKNVHDSGSSPGTCRYDLWEYLPVVWPASPGTCFSWILPSHRLQFWNYLWPAGNLWTCRTQIFVQIFRFQLFKHWYQMSNSILQKLTSQNCNKLTRYIYRHISTYYCNFLLWSDFEPKKNCKYLSIIFIAIFNKVGVTPKFDLTIILSNDPNSIFQIWASGTFCSYLFQFSSYCLTIEKILERSPMRRCPAT